MTTDRLKIQGMSCQHCVGAVKKALDLVGGLRDVRVDLEKGEASFARPEDVSLEKVKRAVEEAGYRVVG
jgi:copper chaperone CopZ